MRTLNLGILAHVDAGKTSLTERLLHAAGATETLGSVDDGSTRTDTLALERQRGITIRSAVASFVVGDVAVNLIDTPGHPDFIAEVERVLGVLDGAVLVVSAVEGVQPQTRVLMRTLRRLRVPTLVFVNKVDRRGADGARVLRGLTERLGLVAVPMGTVRGVGTTGAEVTPYTAADGAAVSGWLRLLAEHDDALLAAYVEDTPVPYDRVRDALTVQTQRARVHPVFFGSALTGVGVDDLTHGLTTLLPAARGDAEGPLSGTVFTIQRGRAGEKVAYLRLFSGTVRVRDRLALGAGGADGPRTPDAPDTVTAISVFDRGEVVPRRSLSAGEIGRVAGLAGARVGDVVGSRPSAHAGHAFAPPTLETVVTPVREADRGALHVALAQLAEQDPLIAYRRDDRRREVSVSLYGEVQKEVLEATLADDFGVDVTFSETTTLCVERVVGSGAAFETLGKEPNPFLATVGLRVDPGPVGAGVGFRLEVELGSMPYAFFVAVEDAVRETLGQGLYGWQVTDCTVTVTHSGYAARQSHSHGTFDKSMSSTAADFRGLAPLVLMGALTQAGTRVHEPVHRFHLELPADALGAVHPVLARLGAVPYAPEVRGAWCVLEGDVPAARVYALRQRLPGLTRGEGVMESAFDRYEPARGPMPTRPRSDDDPLDRTAYLRVVARRVGRRPQAV